MTRRSARRETGLFLAEGAQAVREALAAGVVETVFATASALERFPVDGTAVSQISEKAAASLSETVHPQGVVAVCRRVDLPLSLTGARLAVGLVEPSDPGNAGTILRTADAAGASAVVFAGDGVDPYNGKVVRASAGSLFHVGLALSALDALLDEAGAAGLQVLATTGGGAVDLDALIDDGSLTRPTLWLFGNEAHGLPPDVLRAAQVTVRIPIYGRAESLNLAAAAAVCLYASARAQRETLR